MYQYNTTVYVSFMNSQVNNNFVSQSLMNECKLSVLDYFRILRFCHIMMEMCVKISYFYSEISFVQLNFHHSLYSGLLTR